MQSSYAESLHELRSAKVKRQSQLSTLLTDRRSLQLSLETVVSEPANLLLAPHQESMTVADLTSQRLRLQLRIQDIKEQIRRIESLEQSTLGILAHQSCVTGWMEERGNLWAELSALEDQHAASIDSRSAASVNATKLSAVARLLTVRENTARVVENKLLQGRVSSLAAEPVLPQNLWQARTQQERNELARSEAQGLSLQRRDSIAQSQIAAVTCQTIPMRAAKIGQVQTNLQLLIAERDRKIPAAQLIPTNKAQLQTFLLRTLEGELNKQSAHQQAHSAHLNDLNSRRDASSAAAMAWLGSMLVKKVKETQESIAEAADLRARLLDREVQQSQAPQE